MILFLFVDLIKLTTARAGAEELQPVVADPVTGLRFNLGKECSQVVAFKKDRTTAVSAHKIMFVPGGCGH